MRKSGNAGQGKRLLLLLLTFASLRITYGQNTNRLGVVMKLLRVGRTSFFVINLCPGLLEDGCVLLWAGNSSSNTDFHLGSGPTPKILGKQQQQRQPQRIIRLETGLGKEDK